MVKLIDTYLLSICFGFLFVTKIQNILSPKVLTYMKYQSKMYSIEYQV